MYINIHWFTISRREIRPQTSSKLTLGKTTQTKKGCTTITERVTTHHLYPYTGGPIILCRSISHNISSVLDVRVYSLNKKSCIYQIFTVSNIQYKNNFSRPKRIVSRGACSRIARRGDRLVEIGLVCRWVWLMTLSRVLATAQAHRWSRRMARPPGETRWLPALRWMLCTNPRSS